MKCVTDGMTTRRLPGIHAASLSTIRREYGMPCSAPTTSVGAVIAPTRSEVSGSGDGAAGRILLKLSSHIRRSASGWDSNVPDLRVVDELEPQAGPALGVARGLGPDAVVLVAPPREDRLALGIAFQQPRHVGLDDRQAADEAGLAQGGAKRDRSGEADDVYGPTLQPPDDGDQVGRVRVGRVVAFRRRWTASVEPVAVGNEPIARSEHLPLGLPVAEIQAASVREHHRDTRALVHVLELDTVHLNVLHGQPTILGSADGRA